MPDPDWDLTYSNVVALARHLVTEKYWTGEELLGFLEKPRAYSDKWLLYRAWIGGFTCEQCQLDYPRGVDVVLFEQH